jgi:hypothetical protein
VRLLASFLLLPMVDDRPTVRLEKSRRPFFVRFTPDELDACTIGRVVPGINDKDRCAKLFSMVIIGGHAK